MAYDVWLVKPNQIYRGMPLEVLAGWVQQGRAAAADKISAAGANAWVPVDKHPIFRDYIRRAVPLTAVNPKAVILASTVMPPSAVDHHGDLEAPEPLGHNHDEEVDDEVDMIPLIDISLVLLIFFMMTSVVSALSPVEVPTISSGMEVTTEADAVSVQIDLRANGSAFYALQVGKAPVTSENNNLETLPEVKGRLDAVLAGISKAPEARITCNKKIKHVRVQELVTVLDEYRRRGLISVYKAEVNEMSTK